MSKISKRGMRRLVGAVAISAAATVGLAGMGAGEAAAKPLANGSKVSTGIDGLRMEIKRTGESAVALPSVANNGAGRSAMTSGTYTVNLSKGNGVMQVGYLIGCQVDITGLKGGLSGAIGLTSSLSGSLSVPLSPGEVTYVAAESLSIKGSKGTIQMSNFSIDVQQCGGYASARSVVTAVAGEDLEIEDKTITGSSGFLQSSLYGQPFSLN